MVQLIDDNSEHESPTDYDALSTAAGIAEVATYADRTGPSIDHLLEWSAPGAAPRLKPLATFAATLRIDDLPKNAPSLTAVLDALTKLAKIDGLFSDFPDVVVRYRASR